MAFISNIYKTPQYGEKEYKQAVSRYGAAAQKYGDLISGAVGDVREGVKEASNLRSYYAPGGKYGRGQAQRTKESIEQGVAKTNAQLVASGQSSLAGSRGINVLAASEYAKGIADIEDQRAGLQMQAFQPYTQMISNLANLATAGVNLTTAAPKRGQYVMQGQPYISGRRVV